jgi:hypothetical protein
MITQGGYFMEFDDPIAKKLSEARRRKKDIDDLEKGEFELAKQYAERARHTAVSEIEQIDLLVEKRLERLSAADVGVSRWVYDRISHTLSAGGFCLTIVAHHNGFYRLYAQIGWHPNRLPVLDDSEPPSPLVFDVAAREDDAGFYWLNVSTEARYSSESLVGTLLGELAAVVTQET